MPVLMPAKTANYDPVPEGSHIGVCYRVIDLGTQETTYKGQIKHARQLMLSWELPDERMDDGRPYSIHRRYTYSSSPKSNLRKDLEAWRGKKFEDAELGTFDISRLLGVGCMLGVIHDEKPDGNIYANISTLMRLPRGTQTPKLENDPVAFSLDDRPFDWAMFEALGERMQDTIKKSPEYERAISNMPAQDEPPPATEDSYGSWANGGPDDDPIPF